MADPVSDRYRKAERQRLGGIPALSQVMGAAPPASSPLLGQQAMTMLAQAAAQHARDKPVAVDRATAQAKWEQSLPPFNGLRNEQALPAYQQPFTGLHNEPYGANGLPPVTPMTTEPVPQFQPEMSRQMNYGPGPTVQPPPQMTAPPAMQPAAMPASTEPVPQDVGGTGALERLAQALARKQMAPWAVNEGNFADQYGG